MSRTDPTMDPTTIDWAPRRAAAMIPFALVDGRPVNPYAPTGVRYGRGELGHWGEQQCADALVTLIDPDGRRLLMVERSDGHGWALPGGKADPGEPPVRTAYRELAEETGLHLWEWHQATVRPLPARYVPDPRASDEAWMVTTPFLVDLGPVDRLPTVAGADDALRAVWVPAPDYPGLACHLADSYGGEIFAAHRDLLRDALEVTR